jgi:CHAT domain-containing protein
MEGGKWGHFACHGNLDSYSLMLAEKEKTLGLGAGKRGEGEEEEEEEDSAGDRVQEQGFASEADLTMEEVQGSVSMGVGSTVVLSACNSGRGEIRAEGVVGLARGFLFADAAATVVSLWNVDDGSTSALMKQMHTHLMDGRTTAQALRLAMLHLLHGHSESGRGSRWRRPRYWSAFLVVGANTRLPGVSVRMDTRDDESTLPHLCFGSASKKKK